MVGRLQPCPRGRPEVSSASTAASSSSREDGRVKQADQQLVLVGGMFLASVAMLAFLKRKQKPKNGAGDVGRLITRQRAGLFRRLSLRGRMGA